MVGLIVGLIVDRIGVGRVVENVGWITVVGRTVGNGEGSGIGVLVKTSVGAMGAVGAGIVSKKLKVFD